MLKAARPFSIVAERASLGRSRLPAIKNEPMFNYKTGSPERAALEAALKKWRNTCIEVPCVVGGEEIKTGKITNQIMPSDHRHVLCKFHKADEKTLKLAIERAAQARKKWAHMPFEDRAAIFLKAADLLSTKYRADACAAVMLGTGKNVWQAEIDAAAETIDFFRFNCKYAETIYGWQPPEHAPFTWNRVEYRPLEGFVAAVSPFNFVSIGSNLAGAPAVMGNVVLSKVASTAVLSNYVVYKTLLEAGLPPGVINFVPCDGTLFSKVAMVHPDFSGLHFTGSNATFNTLWRTVANNLEKYKCYPRLVGETGGKNFHVMAPQCDVDNAMNQTVRSAFEYQGQKCSACSRVYVPNTSWDEVKSKLLAEVKKIKIGQPEDFSIFMTAVIDRASFNNIKSYIEYAKKDKSCKIICGGGCDDSKGFFVEPTIIVTTNPHFKTIEEEIFGPVLTVYVYDAAKYDDLLHLVDTTSPYALTGAVFCSDRYQIEHSLNALRNSSGNFYINDKCTGAVVGQQPFGGARASGTNDKAGAEQNLLRWVSPRAIKETFLPIAGWAYPHMA